MAALIKRCQSNCWPDTMGRRCPGKCLCSTKPMQCCGGAFLQGLQCGVWSPLTAAPLCPSLLCFHGLATRAPFLTHAHGRGKALLRTCWLYKGSSEGGSGWTQQALSLFLSLQEEVFPSPRRWNQFHFSYFPIIWEGSQKVFSSSLWIKEENIACSLC